MSFLLSRPADLAQAREIVKESVQFITMNGHTWP
ncbi:integrase [Salmonella enterica subsp. enterica serovar Madelia]|nr:integrase [Salmonella enterica subsp. enterica serovar Madelia]